MADEDVHLYLSTACVHKKHNQCRQKCKFCDNDCRCICHAYDRRATTDALTQKEQPEKRNIFANT